MTKNDLRATIHDALNNAYENGAFDKDGGALYGESIDTIVNDVYLCAGIPMEANLCDIKPHVASWLLLNRAKLEGSK